MPSFWNSVMVLRPWIFRAQAAGVETRVVEAGPIEGEAGATPVLMIHGASGHLESFLLTLPYVAGARRAVAFDLPFHGYASCATRPYDVVDHARFVAQLARELALDPVILVGQSLGGAIAARIAIDRMLDVERLVLLGCAGVPGQPAGDPAHSMRAGLRERGYDDVRRRLEYAMTSRDQAFDELVECRYLAYQWGDWETRADAFAYHETPEGRRAMTASEEEWGRIDVPTLLVWGADDRVVPPVAGEHLSKLVAGARLVVVEGCGHNPQFERPDEVNPLIASFLAGR